MKTHIVRSQKDLEVVALLLLEQIKIQPVTGAFVLGVSGNLGAGKTTLTQVLAKKLGVVASVKSPTFLLMEAYSISFDRFHRLIHIDAYRLDKPEELANIGFFDLIKDNQNLIIVEWPEKVSSIMPEHTFRVNLFFVDENTRKISF